MMRFHIFQYFIGMGQPTERSLCLISPNKHVERLTQDGTWVKNVDLYMASIAFQIDLISIHEINETIIRPSVDRNLYQKVPAIINLVAKIDFVKTCFRISKATGQLHNSSQRSMALKPLVPALNKGDTTSQSSYIIMRSPHSVIQRTFLAQFLILKTHSPI